MQFQRKEVHLEFQIASLSSVLIWYIYAEFRLVMPLQVNALHRLVPASLGHPISIFFIRFLSDFKHEILLIPKEFLLLSWIFLVNFFAFFLKPFNPTEYWSILGPAHRSLQLPVLPGKTGKKPATFGMFLSTKYFLMGLFSRHKKPRCDECDTFSKLPRKLSLDFFCQFKVAVNSHKRQIGPTKEFEFCGATLPFGASYFWKSIDNSPFKNQTKKATNGT